MNTERLFDRLSEAERAVLEVLIKECKDNPKGITGNKWQKAVEGKVKNASRRYFYGIKSRLLKLRLVEEHRTPKHKMAKLNRPVAKIVVTDIQDSVGRSFLKEFRARCKQVSDMNVLHAELIRYVESLISILRDWVKRGKTEEKNWAYVQTMDSIMNLYELYIKAEREEERKFEKKVKEIAKRSKRAKSLKFRGD